MKCQGVVKLFFIGVAAVLIAGVSSKRFTKIGTARIVNGEAIQINHAPYMVQLRDPKGYTYCAGTLVKPQFVVTAAHCFPDNDPKHVTVVGGATSRSDKGEQRRIAQLSIHPSYNKPTKQSNDVAVLKLDKPFVLSEKIDVMKYLCSAPVDINALLQVTGWGRVSVSGSISDQLHSVRLPAFTHDQCVAKVGADKLADSMICAGGLGADACQTDGGGPAMYRGELCGIRSWETGCERSKLPSVYTDVVAVRDFIVKVVKGSSS